jgi:threonylcarbamoyladenosine tRNA methylthiotransferase MtaB
MAGDKHICRHFHIPLQSGSDRVLTSMRRRYNREFYRDLVLKTSALIPGSAFTADVMVGYSTETEADFQDTYDLINELPIYDLHVFKYSQRAGTSAADLKPQIEAAVKQHRSKTLLELGLNKKKYFLHNFLGQELKVLVESHLFDDMYSGLSDNYIEVRFNSNTNRIGEFVPIILTEAREDWAVGDVCSKNMEQS